MSDKLPNFRYHPDPISSEVFVPSSKICPVCNKVNSLEYVGPFYSIVEVDGICPWCIANGKAAEKYDLTFVDEDEIEKVDNEQFVDELTKRTPGFFFPQEDNWPSHCGDYCVLIGTSSEVNIESKFDLLQNDILKIIDNLNISEENLKAELIRDNSPLWGTLFKCSKCDNYRLVADYE
ncbi:CbrC family protein [Psychromonas sp. PT13]|uniref:CbrC family protein n=1 Tax=Psychromonas sp. PT13 TaxID=3439547 RepID=UPI003EBE5855